MPLFFHHITPLPATARLWHLSGRSACFIFDIYPLFR